MSADLRDNSLSPGLQEAQCLRFRYRHAPDDHGGHGGPRLAMFGRELSQGIQDGFRAQALVNY